MTTHPSPWLWWYRLTRWTTRRAVALRLVEGQWAPLRRFSPRDNLREQRALARQVIETTDFDGRLDIEGHELALELSHRVQQLEAYEQRIRVPGWVYAGLTVLLLAVGNWALTGGFATTGNVLLMAAGVTLWATLEGGGDR